MSPIVTMPGSDMPVIEVTRALWVSTLDNDDAFIARSIIYFEEGDDFFQAIGQCYPASFQTPESLLNQVCAHIESNINQHILNTYS